MQITTLILFVGGVIGLIGGAELLVRGAARLAAAVGISPLVIGLTVVAFGTGSPELAVGVKAALGGQADLALGNVVGSNIMNVLFILGISALVTPLVVSQQLVRLDVPLMIGAAALLFVLSLDGSLGRVDGVLLFSGIIVYTGWAIYTSRRKKTAMQREFSAEFGLEASEKAAVQHRWYIQLLYIVAGLAMLIIGADWLVDGAVVFAEALGVSQLVIGLTVVAVGTSLPEVAISVIASLRGERDIAVGNVVGSNLFNILAVLGMTALVSKDGIAVPLSARNFDLIVLMIVSLACLPVFWVNYTIARWEGAVFLIYYIVYTLYLLLRTGEHSNLPIFSTALTLFVLPLTAITLMTRVVRYRRVRKLSSNSST